VVAERRRIAVLPTTRLGRWAVGFALANPVLVTAWAVLPLGAALGFASGVVGGVFALLAIRRHGERALAVFASILPLVMVVVFVLAELLVGHD
jgi:hypothetical protein